MSISDGLTRMSDADPLYAIPVTTLDGKPETLASYRGRVLLIVNVASACGYTPQYEGLEALHRRYQAEGLSILGFPCNQFGRQEPGDAAEIRTFCSTKYDVTFPLFAKVEVNGANAHPLFALLKARRPGILGTGAIKWNFTKFLVDRSGTVVDRYAPFTSPDAIEADIRLALRRRTE
jgi:glutathione peroxidase